MKETEKNNYYYILYINIKYYNINNYSCNKMIILRLL